MAHREQQSALAIDNETFRRIGHQLVEEVADFYASLREKPVAPGLSPPEIRRKVGSGALPEEGESPADVLSSATQLLMNNSLITAHPRFWGYIIGPGTQIGTLADMLAATVNQNVGGWHISPTATEIEQQTVRWIADWVDYPAESGGILVSGGAMANYIGFLTARRKQLGAMVRTGGLRNIEQTPIVYCSQETHTWIQKAADLFGHGTNDIRWIPTDDSLKMNTRVLIREIEKDKEAGNQPFLVIGTAGTVSSGVIDDLRALSDICKRYGLWFHVDGAYGAPACRLPELKDVFDGLSEADSIALDPHKWFYCPQEAGCTLVRNKQHLFDTYSYRPPYYQFDQFEEPGINYYEYGFQNSRGFRALKVWMGMRQAGVRGLNDMIRHDIKLAQHLHDIVDRAPDFEAVQTSLSITTFRYVPDRSLDDTSLNALNKGIMLALQNSGKAYVTNAVINDRFLLRACILNFRTTQEDVEALPGFIREIAGEV